MKEKVFILDLIKNEGDKKFWTYTCDNGIQFDCSIRRVPRSGHLCGYVHLTPDNDYFGVDYDNISVNCHGGLTYAGDNGTDWIIGFDCAHLGDLKPFYNDMEIYGNDGTYRDMEYVTKECESICEQISEKSISHKRTNKINQLI
jgi:hypothetical protein